MAFLICILLVLQKSLADDVLPMINPEGPAKTILSEVIPVAIARKPAPTVPAWASLITPTLYQQITPATISLIVSPQVTVPKFQTFVTTYNPVYATNGDTVTLNKKLLTFDSNLDVISSLNAAQIAAGGTAAFDVGPFADLTADEFTSRRLRYTPPTSLKAPITPLTYSVNYLWSPNKFTTSTAPTLPIIRAPIRTLAASLAEIKSKANTTQIYPPGIDYREIGWITDVKDQGQCGSCWAFAAVETVESFAIFGFGLDQLWTLSTMQVTECTYKTGYSYDSSTGVSSYGGCAGGNFETAWEQIKARGGLVIDFVYKYSDVAADMNNACQWDQGYPGGQAPYPVLDVHDWQSCSDLFETLRTLGPPAVSVAANSWQHYNGKSILKICTGPTNHAVQVVGFVNGPQPYWIVRNSWSKYWGDQGYIYIDYFANGGNLCNIRNEIAAPVITSGWDFKEKRANAKKTKPDGELTPPSL